MTLTRDPDTAQVLAALSVPETNPGFSRRRFLQSSAIAGGGVAFAPMLSQLEAFAAPPLKSTDTILVLIMLSGGNDSLNMVVPHNDSNYHALRPTIGLDQSQTLNISTAVGLHPALVKMKQRYDAGDVALIQGVGYNPPDFSHFTSMGYWMQGWGGASQGVPTGWVGRYLDDLPNAAIESLYAVTLNTNGVPLHLVGSQGRGSALPMSVGGRFGINRSNQDDARLYDDVATFARAGRSGLGQWGDTIARTNANVLRMTGRIAPAYPANPNSNWFVRQMELVAGLVNRNLGIRVFNVTLNGFDTHTGQLAGHADLMDSLDKGIDALFTKLSPSWADNVMSLTFSEFGRRPEENDGAGTDHGTSGAAIAVGPRVKGGLYGQMPSLANAQLVDYGNLKSHVDYRSVYATVLQKWMNADDKQILGKTYSQLGFVNSHP